MNVLVYLVPLALGLTGGHWRWPIRGHGWGCIAGTLGRRRNVISYVRTAIMAKRRTMMDGTTPLVALDAVVIDSETTGLDPRSARVVELATVRLVGGRLEIEGRFAA